MVLTAAEEQSPMLHHRGDVWETLWERPPLWTAPMHQNMPQGIFPPSLSLSIFRSEHCIPFWIIPGSMHERRRNMHSTMQSLQGCVRSSVSGSMPRRNSMPRQAMPDYGSLPVHELPVAFILPILNVYIAPQVECRCECGNRVEKVPCGLRCITDSAKGENYGREFPSWVHNFLNCRS